MLRKLHYLYVEDDPLSREVMQIIMESGLGINTLTIFSDSKDFISRLRLLSHVPAVIMLDIHILPYNGFELLTAIRQDHTYDQTKIIALTATIASSDLEKIRNSGFDGIINKPLSLQTFPTLLENIINGQSVWHIF